MAVEPGDVLSVTIVEAPAMDRDARVDADGRIMIPRIGGIPVAGQDLDAIRGRIEAALVSHQILKTPTVVVEVSSYRPFYVGGTIAHPGAIPFQPGLTVRHAIILAGGLDRANGPDRLSTTDLLDLKAKWRTSSYRLLEVHARIARLEAELAAADHLDLGALDASGVRPADATAVTARADAQFGDATKMREDERAHYRDVLSLVDLEIDVLTRQGTIEEQDRDLQEGQVKTAQALVDKGVMPLPRLQELERERSRLTRDLLDNQAYAARARQNKESRKYELDVTDIRHRIELRRELAAAELDRVETEAQLEVQSSALLSAGIALADRTAPPPEPAVTIHRVAGGGAEQTIAGTMDTPVRPGDVLDVAIARVPQG